MFKAQRKILYIVLFLMTILLSACGGGGDSDNPPTTTTTTTTAKGNDKVLTIYFAGTGNTVGGTEIIGDLKKYDPELLSTLYRNDTSDANLLGDGSKYKAFVDGVGTHGCLLSAVDPLTSCRSFAHCLSDATKAFNKVGESEDLILNLIGFSRGGILPMMMARWVADNGKKVNKINILAFDPVPGMTKNVIFSDPIGLMGDNFTLPDIVNQYVGVYARDERSYKFEPVIPEYDTSVVKDMLVSVRGSHETMDGNLEIDGHSATVLPVTAWMLTRDNRLKNIYHISRGISERLLSGAEWGEVSFNPPFFTADAKLEFLSYVDGMYNDYPSFDYWMMHSVSFLGPLFGHVDLLYEILGRDHSLLLSSVIPLHSRLAYRAPYRHNPEPFPFLFPNPDQVYLLDNYVSPIDGEKAWARMEYLRGEPTLVEDTIPPVPTVDPLPTIIGQCSVTLTTAPTAMDNVDGTIKGITDDPLSYTEQGTYTIIWTYTDQAGNLVTQTQTVIVEDTIPPEIESISASPNILWPANHKMVSVLIDVSVTDNCSEAPLPECQIISVSSNESENGLGDGNTVPDWQIEEDLTVKLRAERSGTGSGRVYTITAECTDAVENSSISTVIVTVPHDQGNHK